MHPKTLKELATETIGRILTPAEEAEVRRAAAALELAETDITVRRIIFDQQLRSLILKVLKKQEETLMAMQSILKDYVIMLETVEKLHTQQGEMGRAVELVLDGQAETLRTVTKLQGYFWKKPLQMLLAGLVVVFGGFLIGYRAGIAELTVERQSVEWLQSPGGKAARRLYEMGLALPLAECSGPEWRAVEGFCYPAVTRGYRLPPPLPQGQ